MIESKCPDCGSPGLQVDWRPFPGLLEEHVFACSNITCVRARLPWSIFNFKPRKVAS